MIKQAYHCARLLATFDFIRFAHEVRLRFGNSNKFDCSHLALTFDFIRFAHEVAPARHNK